MYENVNFWGVFVTPWTRENRLPLSLYLSVLIAAILGIVYIVAGQMNLHLLWLFLMPVGFYAIHLIVGLRVDRLRRKLPPNHIIQTDCIIVNNALQMPGIAHLGGGRLILQPLIKRQISIPLDDIQQIRERRWYNGQGYWGKTIFFEIPGLNRWRLGFGVADAKRWRDALSKYIKGSATE